MSKRNYGIPYMGSKNRIAKQIIDFLPSGETLVDLFGGGGAITDCASESGKWTNIIYNELDVLPYTCFLKALKGEYENETRWISREDFFKLKDTDEYVACCFSFGNNFRDYMYSQDKEPLKKKCHEAIMSNPDYIKAREEIKFGSMQKARVKIQDEILGLKNSKQNNIERIQNVEALERLQAMKRIQNIERLERLQQLKTDSVDNILFYNDDYRNVELPANAIIYCDIPYKQTQKYNSSIEFDYNAFYDWCIDKKKQGYQVFISEYSMPEDKFECVFEMSKITSLAAKKSSRVTEKIFVPKNML
jgi:site-specific DNA-adenine methylase